MGMLFFVAEDGTNVVMDSETSIDVSKSNTVATSSVLSNRTVATDLLEGNFTVSVMGVITYSKTKSQEGNPTPEEWVDLIEDAISKGTRFTLYATKYQGGNPLLKDYSNMVIQDYGYVVDRFEDTITARITFKEVFVTKSATITFLEPVISSQVKGSYQKPTTGGSSASTANSTKTTEQYTEAARRAKGLGANL